MDFKQAERKFKQLKDQFETGALSENAFKAKLEELMIKDERGDWWMIGYETERWYRNDGKEWIQADPPGSLSPEAVPPSKTGNLAEGISKMSDWSAMFWATLGWVVGGAIGGWIYWTMDDSLGFFGGATSGIIGGLSIAGILYIGRVRSNWRNLLWIALGWALGGAVGWSVGEALTEASGAAVGGAIAGVVGLGITSPFERGLANWKSVLWVTLAWTLSAAIGWIIAREIQFNVDGEIGWPVGRAISGAIGGFVTIWQLRKR